jgi:hypothetical protein
VNAGDANVSLALCASAVAMASSAEFRLSALMLTPRTLTRSILKSFGADVGGCSLAAPSQNQRPAFSRGNVGEFLFFTSHSYSIRRKRGE